MRISDGSSDVCSSDLALPGTIAGPLDRPAGSFEHEVPALGEGGVGPGRVRSLIRLADERGKLADRTVRDDLMRLHTMVEITTWHLGRMKSGNAATGGEGNLAKLRNSDVRSEEHTSELQSLMRISYAVLCLKKKTKKKK